MDLLCTENIMLNDNELLCREHSNSAISSTSSPYSTYSSTSSGYNSNASSNILCSSCSSTCSCSSNGAHAQTHCSTTSTLTTANGAVTSNNTNANNSLLSTTTNTTTTAGASSAFGDEQQQQQYYQPQQQQQHSSHQSSNNNVYTNNIINRSLDYVNTATEDPTFLTDRCLENALKAEEKRPHTVCTYFKTVQKDITPPMRKIVAEWMMEVCAEQKCQEEVVLLALNYMDRFLSTKSVRKTHLQILAAACLLLASKLREPSCRALSAELLVFYTDNSIYKGDLIQWELYVLSRLGWDLSSVTPLDFLELLLIRLPITSTKCPDLNVEKVRQHAQAFISLAAKEHYFSMYSASTIAASSIAAALSGLNWHLRTGRNLRYLLNRLTDLTSIEQDYLHDCMVKMESIFEEHSRNLLPYPVSMEPVQQQHQKQQQQHFHQQQQHHHQNQQHFHNQHQQQQHQHQHHHHQNHGGMSSVGGSHNNNNNNNSGKSISMTVGNTIPNIMLPSLTQTCKMQANAQKDMQNIKF